MARIAVDARPLSAVTTGIGRYTEAILSRLVKSEHHFYLYSHQPLHKSFVGLPNVTVRYGNIRAASLGSVFAQAVFPYWAWRDGVQLFWSPRHHLPLCLASVVRTVVTIHDLVWQQYPNTMTRSGLLLERLLTPPTLKGASAVIAVSNGTRDELQKSFPRSASKVQTIYEAPFLEPVVEPGRSGNYFLFVGTIEPRKNLTGILEAYAHYTRVGNLAIPLKICGGKGWGLGELEAVIEESGLIGQVEVLGYVDDADLPGLYRNARALLIPSLYEGFGLPIVEAFSQGTPVITSKRGAMQEIAGDAGLLVDPENVEDMAAALSLLSDNLVLVKQLQQRALARSRLFSWDAAAEETLSLMESLLAS